MNENDIESVRRRLADAKHNLRLICERMSKYVLETEISLQLIREKERLEQEIIALQAQLESLRPSPHPPTEAPPEPGRRSPRIPIPWWRSPKVWVILALIGLAGVIIPIIVKNLVPDPLPNVVQPELTGTRTFTLPSAVVSPTQTLECSPGDNLVPPSICVASVSVQINKGTPQPVTFEEHITLKAEDTLRLVNLRYCTSHEDLADAVAGEAYLFPNGVVTYTYGLFTRRGAHIRAGCGDVGVFESNWIMEPGRHRVCVALMHYFSDEKRSDAQKLKEYFTGKCKETGECEVDDRFYFNLDVGS